MENIVIIVSVIAEILLTSWMFDGLVHWSDHLHNWEKKMSEKITSEKYAQTTDSDDPKPGIVNG